MKKATEEYIYIYKIHICFGEKLRIIIIKCQDKYNSFIFIFKLRHLESDKRTNMQNQAFSVR